MEAFLVIIFAIVVLVVASAVFSGSSTPLSSADREKASTEEKEFAKALRRIDWADDRFEGTFSRNRPGEETPTTPICMTAWIEDLTGVRARLHFPTPLTGEDLTPERLRVLGGMLPGSQTLRIVTADRRDVVIELVSRDAARTTEVGW